LDTSPKGIDREGLGKSRTGTRQQLQQEELGIAPAADLELLLFTMMLDK